MFIEKYRAIRQITNVDSDTTYRLTVPQHGLVTGDRVYIKDSNHAAINGEFTVTRVDDDRIKLDGTTYASGWTGGGVVHIFFELVLTLPSATSDFQIVWSWKQKDALGNVELKSECMATKNTDLVLFASDLDLGQSLYQLTVYNPNSSAATVVLSMTGKAGTKIGSKRVSLDQDYTWEVREGGAVGVLDETGRDVTGPVGAP